MDFNLGLPWEVVKLKFMLCLISYDEFYIHAFYILPRFFFFFFFFSLSLLSEVVFFLLVLDLYCLGLFDHKENF